MSVPASLHLALVALVCWSIICRARLMDATTRPRVRLQHGLLNAAAIASLLVPPPWAAPVLVAGMATFFALSADRWRHEAPAGTRPMDLDAHPLQQAAAGRKDAP